MSTTKKGNVHCSCQSSTQCSRQHTQRENRLPLSALWLIGACLQDILDGSSVSHSRRLASKVIANISFSIEYLIIEESCSYGRGIGPHVFSPAKN